MKDKTPAQQPGLLRLIVTAQSYLGLAPSQLADSCGISLNTWYSRRKNLDKMNLGELRSLRQVMNIEKEDFLKSLDI